jgi:hypothetical protein
MDFLGQFDACTDRMAQMAKQVNTTTKIVWESLNSWFLVYVFAFQV